MSWFEWLCFIDDELSSIHLNSVKSLDSGVSFSIISHSHKTETSGSAGHLIHDDIGGFNGSSWFVETTQSVVAPPLILVNDGGLGFHSNQFGFNARAIPGQAVVLEASTNFANWVPLRTNLAASLGQIVFADSQSGQMSRRFYRLRIFTGTLPPPAILTQDGAFGMRAGHFGFNLGGTGGQTVVIETSTNLTGWLPLLTNTLGATPFYFSDPGTPNARRFYRARLP